MFIRQIVRRNIPSVAVLLFVSLFTIIQLLKPAFLYNSDGSVRQFGVGYKNKTILPLWLFTVILGVLSYLAVLFYLSYPKLQYT